MSATEVKARNLIQMGLKMLKTQELPGALPPGPCLSPQTPGLIFRVFLQMPLSSLIQVKIMYASFIKGDIELLYIGVL